MVFICKFIQVRINSFVGIMIGLYHLTKTDQNFNNTLTSLYTVYSKRVGFFSVWFSLLCGVHGGIHEGLAVGTP